MPNPVDDSPVGPGEITLPSDSDPSVNATDPTPSGLRKFRRRALYVAAVCCTLVLVAFRDHPPTVGRPVDELAYDAGNNLADDPRLEPYQRPEDADYCVDLVSGPDHFSSARFELPTSSDLLFFLSRGPVSGHISITKTPNYSTGPVEVNVTAQYHAHGNLQRTQVCQMGQGRGVLLWAEPRHPHGDPKRNVRFNITVALPTGVKNYKDVTTDLPLFSHNVGDFFDIWSPTTFEVIRLKSSNAAIDFGSLISQAAFIQNNNAEVKGFYGGLEVGVQTSNARIDVTALMFGSHDGSESKVTLRTSNGEIKSLLGISSDFVNNTLRVTIQTSHAPLIIDAPRLMADTRFFLDAATSAAPTTVQVAPEFEGVYDIQTSVAKAEVEVMDVKDPTGQGRHRTVVKERTGRHAQGRAYWSGEGDQEEGVQRGFVKISTSVSPVKLIL
ncbi:hypothetical protein C8F04DRAFT_1123733 [Mycena alexandri]|uniref:Uncharacterized protein n=1 Tax=Mycena alexandri TaxID=1745969 RepID=A0AAD6WTV2_9AGAR|nr:hypothetical protein C8F04DRAFT_1123733 [Mycena alexandri]